MRTHRRSSVVALLAGLMVILGLYAVPSANAAYGDPGAVSVGITFTNTSTTADKAGDTLKIGVRVTAADGSDPEPTGTVSINVGDGVPVALPVGPYSYATFEYVIPSNSPFDVTATFVGTNGWHDGTATKTFTPLTRIYWAQASPTVATITGGLPKLTLKFAAYRRNGLGEGVAGRKITFSLFAQMPFILSPSPAAVPVCTAITDANGYASCSGLASLATIVSLLNNGAFANDMGNLANPTSGYQTGWIKIPAITVS